MNDYDEFKIWYTQKAPDESEVTMVDMAAMAWQAARAASPKVPQSDLEIRCKVLTALLEEHVLLDHLDWDEDDWCRRAELAIGPELGGVFNEMFEAKNKALPQGVEEWIAEHGLQYVDTLGGYGVKLKRSSELKYPCPEYVSVDDLRALLSGMALVPVDALNSIMELAGVALVYQPFGTKDRQHFDALLAATKEKGE